MGLWAWVLGVGALVAPIPAEEGRTTAVTKGAVTLAQHFPLDDVDPAAAPRTWAEGKPLTVVAAAGERERVAFVVYSGGHSGTLDVQIAPVLS